VRKAPKAPKAQKFSLSDLIQFVTRDVYKQSTSGQESQPASQPSESSKVFVCVRSAERRIMKINKNRVCAGREEHEIQQSDVKSTSTVVP
jgi:hypothetical protein